MSPSHVLLILYKNHSKYIIDKSTSFPNSVYSKLNPQAILRVLFPPLEHL